MTNTIVINGKQLTYTLTYKKVKNINVRIKPDGSVNVSANRLVQLSKIEKFLIQKSDFIFNALERFKCISEVANKLRYFDNDGEIYIYGFPKKVKISYSRSKSCLLENDVLNVLVPEINNKLYIRRVIDTYLLDICKSKVLDIVERILPCFKWQGIDYQEIYFRKMKSRWGSCRPESGILTFNTYLAFVPVRCMEYVVLHEFVHFLHPNHSKEFYKCVEKYMPDWKERKLELDKYSGEIIH